MLVTTAAVGAASQASSSPASRARPMARQPGRQPSVLRKAVRAQVWVVDDAFVQIIHLIGFDRCSSLDLCQ